MKLNLRKLSPIYLILFVLIASAVFQVNYAAAQADEGNCKITVTSEQHMAPAAELATTKGYPDVITLENSLIKATSVPNRGRLLFDYFFKPTGSSQTFTDTSPLPMETGKDEYFLEFGGYYPSHPWNQRANQPYDLDYEILEESPAGCSIEIFKSGEDFPIHLRARLEVKPDDPKVYVRIELKNSTDSARTINWFDRLIASPGAEPAPGMELRLPEGVTEVILGESDSQWMGKSGETRSWPQPWSKWGQFKGEGHFQVPLKGVGEGKVAVKNPEEEVQLVKEWGADQNYSSLRIYAWGPGYGSILGAHPGFAIATVSSDLTIEPGETKTFRTEIYAEKIE